MFPLVLLACSGEAPTLKVTKSEEINAPAAKVWAKAKDLNALHRWHPAVAKTELTQGQNNQPGAVRVLTLVDGGTITEELVAYDGKGMSFTYKILEGVLPVSDYQSTVTVEPTGGDKSTVTWAGTFRRKDTGANPAEGADDQAATDTMSAVYQAGLNNLKKRSGPRS